MVDMQTPYGQAKDILAVICSDNCHELTYSEAKEALEEIGLDNDIEDDFYLELDGAEYRIIQDDSIEDIFEESVRQLVEDCYDFGELPKWVTGAIDWEKVADACLDDGYGHHFSSYDGSESEAKFSRAFRVG